MPSNSILNVGFRLRFALVGFLIFILIFRLVLLRITIFVLAGFVVANAERIFDILAQVTRRFRLSIRGEIKFDGLMIGWYSR